MNPTSLGNPFRQVCIDFQTEPIQAVDNDSQTVREYVKRVKGDNVADLLIGWLCIEDTFFAYLFRRMKRESRQNNNFSIAENLAENGFKSLTIRVNKWIISENRPVLIIPVASRHGVSERFAYILMKLLETSCKLSMFYTMPLQKNKQTQADIKNIVGWNNRENVVKDIFEFKDTGYELSKYSIILVDDIITSGASLRRSAEILVTNGADRILGVCLATNLYYNTGDKK